MVSISVDNRDRLVRVQPLPHPSRTAPPALRVLTDPHALTPADPTWNPCTVMRTVSPTLALLGDISSLGPLGAAVGHKQTEEEQQTREDGYLRDQDETEKVGSVSGCVCCVGGVSVGSQTR